MSINPKEAPDEGYLNLSAPIKSFSKDLLKSPPKELSPYCPYKNASTIFLTINY